MFWAKNKPFEVAATDFGAMLPKTESILSSERFASGIVLVVDVVVDVVAGKVDDVVLVRTEVDVDGATTDDGEVEDGATAVSAAVTAMTSPDCSCSPRFIATKPTTSRPARSPM